MPRRGGAAVVAVAVSAAGLVGLLIAAPPAQAAGAPNLAIRVPSTLSFGSVAPGARTLSGQLGVVEVTTDGSGSDFSWTARVSTSGFTTGAGSTPNEVVPPSSVTYTASPPTQIPLLYTQGTCTTGSDTATVTLEQARTAYTCSFPGRSLLLRLPTLVRWNPTIGVLVRADNVAGQYAGVITHSVA